MLFLNEKPPNGGLLPISGSGILKEMGEKLKIEPFTPSFLTERYVSWLNDKEVVRYSEQRHRSHSLDSCRAYYESLRNTQHKFWAILAEDYGHIGNMTATVDTNNLTADLAIMIGERSVWGRGYGSLAWQMACDELLKSLRKVTAGTMSVNQPMLSVFRKTGMQIEGARKSQFLFNGIAVDVVLAAKWP